MKSNESNKESAQKEIEILVTRSKLRHRILVDIIEKLKQAETIGKSDQSGITKSRAKK